MPKLVLKTKQGELVELEKTKIPVTLHAHDIRIREHYLLIRDQSREDSLLAPCYFGGGWMREHPERSFFSAASQEAVDIEDNVMFVKRNDLESKEVETNKFIKLRIEPRNGQVSVQIRADNGGTNSVSVRRQGLFAWAVFQVSLKEEIFKHLNELTRGHLLKSFDLTIYLEGYILTGFSPVIGGFLIEEGQDFETLKMDVDIHSVSTISEEINSLKLSMLRAIEDWKTKE